MTSQNTQTDAVGRAKRGIAGKLSRPFNDIDALASDIVNALLTEGWRPPAPPPQPTSAASWRALNPASDESRKAHLTGIRQRLNTIRDARKHTETEDPQ